MNTYAETFPLGIEGFQFHDLYNTEKLHLLAGLFQEWYQRSSPDEYEGYRQYFACKGVGMQPQDISSALISAGRRVQTFLGMLFDIEPEQAELRESVLMQKPIFRFKRDFLQRRVWKKFKPDEAAAMDFHALHARVTSLFGVLRSGVFDDETTERQRSAAISDEELFTATCIDTLMALETELRKLSTSDAPAPNESDAVIARSTRIASGLTSDEATRSLWPDIHGNGISTLSEASALINALMETIERWCFARYFDTAERKRLSGWVSYRTPEPLDYMHLVHVQNPNVDLPQEMTGPDDRLRRRDGFALTDPRYGSREVLNEVEYCVFCHERDKDSCSKGLRDKDGSMKRNPLGITLAGCPLDEKISEMHLLKNEGLSIGALATIIVDNPMCPGTGHRICNDCMKACIYQKQEPVNIPQIETAVLTDVLALPYGYEIYSLLTRWNPLNVHRPVALPYNGKNILVVGLGPAGYTLSHYLLNEGFGVVGIDGLKIEPLDPSLTGRENGFPAPIRNFADIKEELDTRVMSGFGGVSEYGITVRWDKNFLTVIYLTLMRREKFALFGGIRFGGTLTIDDAWHMGFDHIAIATGAGKPTMVDVKNNMSRGMRMASDFLMALQLTGAAKKDTLANLQVQLPALVIGGGLTAIDTATELMAYYPVQVEKIATRFGILVSDLGEDAVWALYQDEEKEQLRRFLAHAEAVSAERRRAADAGEQPDFVPLLRSWGSVKVVYRKAITDSPSYRLNHEEIIKALEEGISFVDCHSPTEIVLDKYDAIEAVIFERQEKNAEGKWRATGERRTLPARSVMVAAGTSPNTIIERENPGLFALDKWGQYFMQYVVDDDDLQEAPAGTTGFFTSYHSNGKYISYYGDNHPVYAGNVVKAMASAREGYKQIVGLFRSDIESQTPDGQLKRDDRWTHLTERLEDALAATVVEIKRYTPSIVDIVVKARFAAEKFQPGQFYRMQNLESQATSVDGTKLTMEGLALTGAWVDKENGLLSMIVLEMGTSSRLCATLKPGDRLVVMGPTGAPTEIPRNENVLLAGGGLGNAVLFSIAKALTENECNVLYFAGYKAGEDLYKREEIEASTTQVIWSTDAGAAIESHRPQDHHFRGNIVQAIKAYGEGEFGEAMVPLHTVTRIIAIGSDRMMAAVQQARHDVLAPYLRHHIGIGSINSPMQCMMKEICAQCLQRHVDPASGKESFVFSCYFQDQELDVVDWKNLNDRLRQNTVMEKLSNRFLTHLLEKSGMEPA